MQCSPSKQTKPQAPQFATSLASVTQNRPHSASDAGQAGAPHAPPLHNWPEGHTLPHAPQFAPSLATLVHAPAQGTSPS
jgi:hypothetical protein